MSRRTSKTLRGRGSRMLLDLRNAIRRVVISGSEGSDWSILGYEYVDPTEGGVIEGEGDEPIPAFQGIGVYARPAGARGEGLMLHVGAESDHPVLAAVRDEDGRRAYVAAFGEVSAGEIAIFNGQGTARVLIKADGSIEIGGIGPALPLPNNAYRTAEDALLGVLFTAFTNLGLEGTLSSGASYTAAATAITTFLTGAAGYLTTSLKGN